MNRPALIFAGLVVVGGACLLGVQFVDRVYLSPRQEKIMQIEKLHKQVKSWEEKLKNNDQVQQKMREVADRTLGGNLESVDHQLRMRLNRIGEAIGLTGLSVSTGAARAIKSPADRVFPRNLRRQADFVELEGTISGRGSFEQVLRLVHRIQNEPWLKQMRHVQIDPKDDSKVCAVIVRLVTIFVPGNAPAQLPLMIEDEVGFEPYETLVLTNPFRVHPLESPTQAPETPLPTFDYSVWSLTAVVRWPAGSEAWFRHRQTGATQRLVPGDRLHEAVLIAANSDSAEFRLGNSRFLVSIGHTLDQRDPVAPSTDAVWAQRNSSSRN